LYENIANSLIIHGVTANLILFNRRDAVFFSQICI